MVAGQSVFIDPNSHAKGVNTEIASQNTNLGQLKGFFTLATEKGKRQEMSNLYNEAAQTNTQPSWEDIGEVYARYGDTAGTERARSHADKRDDDRFAKKASIYMDQYSKAYKEGNNEAVLSVEAQMNQDEDIRKKIDNVKLLGNNQITYVARKDQSVRMGGGKTQEVKAGDQIVAFRGEDGKYNVTSVKPTAISTARVKAEAAGNKPPNFKTMGSFSDDMERLTLGSNKTNDIIYPKALSQTDDPKTLLETYNMVRTRTDSATANGSFSDKAIGIFQNRADKVLKEKLSKSLIDFSKTKAVQSAIRKGMTSSNAILMYMEANEIPNEDFDTIVEIVYGE